MTISAIAKLAQAEGPQMFRLRERIAETKVFEYDCKPLWTGKKKGWDYFDSFTASAVCAVYNALNEQMQPKFDTIPLQRLLTFVWSNVK